MAGYQYDQLSEEIWSQNYQQENEKTRFDSWTRYAEANVVCEKKEDRKKIREDFLEILGNDGFIPGGRIMSNLGIKGREGTTLYNCFVHNPRDIKLKNCDSIDGIYELLKAQAKTLKSEGGYGINASFIRPAGTYIKGIGSRTPGSLKFMELWDKSSEIITQGSVKVLGKRRKEEKKKIRKGAQMLVLSVWHPEIEDFIVAKLTPNRLTKFNLSVGITNGFMEAVINDLDWDLKFPDTEFEKYDDEWFGDIEEWEEKGYPVIVYKTVKATYLWELIMDSTYKRNDPGVLFLDIVNKMNPLYYAEKVFTTNPCGEIPMSTGVCNLGSLNLPMYVKWDNYKKTVWFDFDEYAKAVRIGIRYLDNINDISTTPLPEYKEEVLKKRRIGLGNMGWGSMFFMLGIRFASEESLKLIDKISKIKAENELLASAELGREKGSFKLFDKEKYFNSLWWKTLNIDSYIKTQIEKIGCMRNSHHSMNAPTGNTGIYAKNVSGGIEPVFAREYSRWMIVPEMDRAELMEQGFEFPEVGKGEWKETKHLKFSQRGSEQILKGSFKNKNYEVDKNRGLVIENLVEDYGWKFAKEFYKDKLDVMLKDGVFATSMELSVQDHINSLIHISHYTNQANSKTVNLPNDYPFEDFKKLYLEAWKNNIKGITTYREGTATVVLEVKKDDKKGDYEVEFNENSAPKRPKTLVCDIHQATIKGESWTIFVGKLHGKPYEIFGGLSKFVHIPKKVKQGVLIKDKKRSNGSGIYDLVYGEHDDETRIHDIVSVFENPTEGAFTRMISLALRHGSGVQFVCEQLQKDDKDSDMYSFSKVISRVLKTYIKEGTKASDKKCESCGLEGTVIYMEGCKTCKSCGYSKC